VVHIGPVIVARNEANGFRVSSPAWPFFSIPELLLRLGSRPPPTELRCPLAASVVAVAIANASSLSRARVGWDGLGFRG